MFGEEASRAFGGLKAKIIPDANHSAEYTAAEVVNGEIMAFLVGASERARQRPKPLGNILILSNGT